MDDDITYSSRIYTDIQGIKKLQYDKHSTRAKKEVAQQFEALMFQMVLRSMRDATNAFSSGLFDNKQMELYQDMFDKQLSLVMSNNSLGLAKIIEKNIDQMNGQTEGSNIEPSVYVMKKPPKFSVSDDTDTKTISQVGTEDINELAPKEKTHFSTPEVFVKKLWSLAKQAASKLGTSPEILLAQAALETNWGKNILGTSGISHNLFNIKADTDWDKKVTSVNAVEYKNGVLTKENAKFKNYESYLESFMDYVNLLKNNNRYAGALDKASNPEQFIKALHQAGYATDPNYGDKVLKILSSPMFKELVEETKNNLSLLKK